MAMDSQPLKRVVTYICGNGGPLDEFNPSFVTRQKWTPELLYVLNEHPMYVGQICSTLKIGQKEAVKLLEDLIRINAIKEESGVYYVNFAVFTKEDLMILTEATEPIALELANYIYSYADKVTSLARNFSAAQQVGVEKLLFAAIGCFTLDWLGLKTLEEEGFLITSKPQPGNRNYLLFAREEMDRDVAMKLYDKMYWGSHSDTLGKYVFTSFGDHCGARYAFPDILWSLMGSVKALQMHFDYPQWAAEKVSAVIKLLKEKLLGDAASLLFKLNIEGPTLVEELAEGYDGRWLQNMIQLLVDMGYVAREDGRLKLHSPVFVVGDKEIIEGIGDAIIPLVTQTIRRNRLYLEKALGDTAPTRNKVAFNEILNEAWHWIFAQTNKILAEKGLLHDPPKRRADEARYIAWISEFSFPQTS